MYSLRPKVSNLIIGFVSYPQDESGVLENVIVESVDPRYNTYSPPIIAEKELTLYKSQFNKFIVHSLTPNVTSLGLPIYKMEYSHLNNNLQIKTMEILVENRNHIYRILYDSDASEYSVFVPQVEKIIDSLVIGHQSPPKPSIMNYYGDKFYGNL